MELYGPAATLIAVFGGEADPAQEWVEGRLRALASQGTLQRFEGLVRSIMLQARTQKKIEKKRG